MEFLRVCRVSRALSSFPAHVAAEDDKAKRLREIEDRANRTMDKDFFKGQHKLLTTSIAMGDSCRGFAIMMLPAEYNPRVRLRRLPNGTSFVPVVSSA